MAAFSFNNLLNEIEGLDEDGIAIVDKLYNWNTAEDVKDVVDAINSKEVVRYLTLDGNTLGVEAAKAIGQALEKHPEFCKALWKNMFTSRLKTEIPQALSHLGGSLIMANAHLHTLDLSDNALGPNGMMGLNELLSSSVCYSLKELHMNNCGLGTGGGKMLADALVKCYENSLNNGAELKLEVLVIGRNRLEDKGAMFITKLLSTVCSLKELVMPQNSICHEGMAYLSEGIKFNPNIEVLNFNDNLITDRGAIYLADAFEDTPLLREINFGDCLLRNSGVLHLSKALKANHLNLEVVNLGYNEIELDGALCLVDALSNKPKLKKLNLDGNNFGLEDCESIEKAMKSAANPDALDPIESDEDAEEEGSDASNDYEDGEGIEQELIEDYAEKDDNEIDNDTQRNYCNDTTQAVDEDENEESAYVTSVGFNAKLFDANESSVSNKNVSFAEPNTLNTNVTIETFCLSTSPCTLQMFQSLPQRNLQSFLDFLELYKNTENYLLLLIFTTLKCAHLTKESSEALNLAVELYKAVVDYAVETKQERRITNYLLKQLHLLRSEVKFTSKYNIKSCRHALREALIRGSFSNEYMRNTFQVFLDQFHTI